MSNSELRELFAPVMAHCLVVAAVWGLLLPTMLFWLARAYGRFAGRRLKRELGSKLTAVKVQQFLARLSQTVAIVGTPVFTLAFWSFLYLLKWYYHARSTWDFSNMGQGCTIYLLAFGLSFAGNIWWFGGFKILRPPGYDPKNPNPDPDEWRWQNRNF